MSEEYTRNCSYCIECGKKNKKYIRKCRYFETGKLKKYRGNVDIFDMEK